MPIVLILGSIVLFIAWAIVILNSEDKPTSNKIINKRMKQTEKLSSLNLLKARLKEITEKKVSYKKRTAKEVVYIQAGLKFNYIDHLIISVFSAIALGLICIIGLKNQFAVIPFVLVGYILPFQIITIIRNRRVAILDKQVGVFLKMVLKRYEVTDDFAKAIRYVAQQLEDEYPINKDLSVCSRELELGAETVQVIDHLALRTGNKFIARLAEYYRIVAEIGTNEARDSLLSQAFLQYEEDRQIKRSMREKLSEPVREAYIVLAAVPCMWVYQMATNPEYLPFMTTTSLGKIGTAVIISICTGALWFINNKIGAAIE